MNNNNRIQHIELCRCQNIYLYATVRAGLRTASKGSLPPDQNQTRGCGASKNHQTTTDGTHDLLYTTKNCKNH
uniref:SFRICE_039936 n=1 Tax=Spodoptera frugiperda TaxID=7108 RepID=A0A2H1WKQ8_SPOFR